MSAPSPAATASLTPLRRLAKASTTTCGAKAHAYGQCILSKYQDVSKDACKAEFDQFGACLREAMKRKW